jgi:chromosomal replication initiator protein
VGDDENSLVQVAFEAVIAGDPKYNSPKYNPLVLCGPTGVGKSLLLHSLAHRWRELHPQAKVVVVTGADFARGYAHAVQTDTVADHRARLVQASLLVLDGLEELLKKTTASRNSSTPWILLLAKAYRLPSPHASRSAPAPHSFQG